MNRRNILASLSALVLGLGRTTAANATETVRIGWLRGPNDITLAKARGSLEKALADKGIAVEWAGPSAGCPAVRRSWA